MQGVLGDIRQSLIFLLEYVSYREVAVDGVGKTHWG